MLVMRDGIASDPVISFIYLTEKEILKNLKVIIYKL